jgi:merozoite surface protein 4
MSTRTTRSLVTIAAAAVLALSGGAPAALARHGADDPVGHDAGDDHGGKRVVALSARHGADDPAGHERHAKHRRHAKKSRVARVARHGADDPAGDDRGGRRGGGNDDGPNHT